MIINMSKLRKNYTIKDMSYLDSLEASSLYKLKANLIKRKNLRSVVDVGCRTGEINRYLTDYDYDYYGFDSSIEPIEYASKQYPKQTFEVNDWNNLKYAKCDVIVFGSVLIYDSNPIGMFERICNFYMPKYAIVHEVDNRNLEDLPYSDLTYFDRYKNTKYKFDLNIPVRYRTIIDVEL